MPQTQEQFVAITRDGWYSESGLSPRQSVGVVPDERHELCEWLNNAGTRYPELYGDNQGRLV